MESQRGQLGIHTFAMCNIRLSDHTGTPKPDGGQRSGVRAGGKPGVQAGEAGAGDVNVPVTTAGRPEPAGSIGTQLHVVR